MNLTQISDYRSIIDDICLTTRMQERFSSIWIISFFQMHTDLVKELLYDAFHGEEVAIAIHTKSKLHALIRQFSERQALWQINISHLIETNILISSVIVGCQRSQHSIQGSSSHNREILTQRIGDHDCLTLTCILRQKQFIKYLRAFEAVGHTL